jgi:hypothetical protein
LILVPPPRDFAPGRFRFGEASGLGQGWMLARSFHCRDCLTRPSENQTGCCRGPALGGMAARKMGNPAKAGGLPLRFFAILRSICLVRDCVFSATLRAKRGPFGSARRRGGSRTAPTLLYFWESARGKLPCAAQLEFLDIKNLSANNIPPFAKGGWGDFFKAI